MKQYFPLLSLVLIILFYSLRANADTFENNGLLAYEKQLLYINLIDDPMSISFESEIVDKLIMKSEFDSWATQLTYEYLAGESREQEETQYMNLVFNIFNMKNLIEYEVASKRLAGVYSYKGDTGRFNYDNKTIKITFPNAAKDTFFGAMYSQYHTPMVIKSFSANSEWEGLDPAMGVKAIMLLLVPKNTFKLFGNSTSTNKFDAYQDFQVAIGFARVSFSEQFKQTAPGFDSGLTAVQSMIEWEAGYRYSYSGSGMSLNAYMAYALQINGISANGEGFGGAEDYTLRREWQINHGPMIGAAILF